MKVAVVYWSGTGNTEKMADCIAEGIENAGSEVEVIFCDDFGADMLNDYDLVAQQWEMKFLKNQALNQCSKKLKKN